MQIPGTKVYVTLENNIQKTTRKKRNLQGQCLIEMQLHIKSTPSKINHLGLQRWYSDSEHRLLQWRPRFTSQKYPNQAVHRIFDLSSRHQCLFWVLKVPSLSSFPHAHGREQRQNYGSVILCILAAYQLSSSVYVDVCQHISRKVTFYNFRHQNCKKINFLTFHQNSL